MYFVTLCDSASSFETSEVNDGVVRESSSEVAKLLQHDKRLPPRASRGNFGHGKWSHMKLLQFFEGFAKQHGGDYSKKMRDYKTEL